ncbi:chemotaxis protein CheW [Methanosphaerula palustris]|uniref:CheW protein n=1 Tax=Methanosphaerula palustris (strain ATCC BAA-1556 / DSM 19958 / E1-9c) TaxID=521011 RepID=B8GK04_METPE|nr:chemotaxis protein CheW [Methanosphaerula palustris]ACL17075.1 CheW protein [Methanosphaerula palustris E1-9c]
MAERPGRRALFAGTSAQKRTAIPAPVGEAVAERAEVRGPDPSVERLISTVTSALTEALSGARSTEVHPADLDIKYTPLVEAVNAAVFRLTETPPPSHVSEPGPDPALLKEKEAEIEDLQQRIAAIIQQHPLPVLFVSPDLSIIEANSAFCQMSGLLRSQLIRHQISVIAERERQGDGLATAIRQRLPVEAEITVDLPAGTKMLKQYAVPILDRFGAVEALQVIFTDQTALKQEEKARISLSEEIERQQLQNKNLVDGLPTPVMIIDGADAILDVNPAFCEMSGYSREHLLTVRLNEYANLTALTAGAFLSSDQRRISREISVEFPTGLHLLREDLVLLTEQPGEGLPRGMIILCALEDISSERADEHQVSELSSTVLQQKRLIDTLMRETPVPILLLDPEAVIVSANDAFVTMSGYTLENLLGMPISAFSLLAETGLPVEEIMQQSEGAFGEVKMEFVSGIHDLERYCFPLRDDQGTLTNLLVFFDDQTHEKTQEKTILTLEEEASSRDLLIDQSVEDLGLGISRLADGDFTSHLKIDEGDPFGSIKGVFNTAVDRVRAVIEDYEQTADRQQVQNQVPETAGPSDAEQTLIDTIETIKQDQVKSADRLQESSAGVVLGLSLLGTDGFTSLQVQDQDPLSEVRRAVNSAGIRLAPVQSPVPAPALPTIDYGVLAVQHEPVPVEAAPVETELPETLVPPVKDEDLVPEPVSSVPAAVLPDLKIVSPLQEQRMPTKIEEQRSMATEQNREEKQASTTMVDVVAFEMAGQRYALDIQLAREIVEMIPITPIPRSPPYISGIINLRGEITNILNLYTLLGLPEQEVNQNQKIIVLVPDAAEGINVGIIVDNVQSVTQVPVTDIEQIKDDASSDLSGFVKGIIKAKGDDAEGKTTDLIIWIDMLKVLSRLVNQ